MTFEPYAGRPPVHRRILARAVPVRVFERLYGAERYGFLYESLEEHGGQGRYSFVGGRPLATFRSKGEQAELQVGSQTESLRGNPLELLRSCLRTPVETFPVATFPGGAVGYLGYDVVRFCAPLPDPPADDLDVPDAWFVFPEEILVFDHRDEVVHLLCFPRNAAEAAPRLDAIEAIVREDEAAGPLGPSTPPADLGAGPAPGEPGSGLRANMSKTDFEAMVERAKAHIVRGDIFQTVLSQRFDFDVQVAPLEYFRALRTTNPSPYMYFLNLDGLTIAGSSPEVLVRRDGRRIVTRPLAGTRPRGADAEEDRRLAAELLADPKERAEHLMLIDLARNDLGRVSRVGSIDIETYFEIERYSRVMHITSQVAGKLRDDLDAFDLFAAAFPAGTVSGAPKVRAMQIIDDLEPTRRGPYAGAIGYFSFNGDADLCIAIRTLMLRGGTGTLQAGAGIVADSVPELEYRETLNKARGLVRAIRLAERSAACP